MVLLKGALLRHDACCDMCVLTMRACPCPSHHSLRAVLYNFEYLTRQDEQGQYKQSWVNDDFVDVHRAFTVWEYSYANQVKWRSEYGIEPVMVPIGYVPSMHVSDPQPEAEKDIDVLFDGTSNPYREAVIGEIVGAGINVVWRAVSVVAVSRAPCSTITAEVATSRSDFMLCVSCRHESLMPTSADVGRRVLRARLTRKDRAVAQLVRH